MLKCRGFTLIELLVSIFIIILMSGIIFANYRAGGRQFALQRSANKLAQDIRRAQQMAMSAKECPPEICGGTEPIIPYGYGVRLKQEEPEHYILFADQNNNQDYDPGTDGIVEDTGFEKDVKISDISNNPLRITFAPPDPTVTIKPGVPAWVELSINSQYKTIRVNEAGLIEIK